MARRASLPREVLPFTLFAITGSFMMMGTGFVDKNMLIGYAQRLHNGSEPCAEVVAGIRTSC